MEICDFLKSWKRMCNSMTEMKGCEDCPIVRNTHGARCGDMPCEMQDVEFIAREVEKWAAKHPEPVYPTWGDYLLSIGVVKITPDGIPVELPNGDIMEPSKSFYIDLNSNIKADIAEKLGIQPKEDV